MISGPSLICKGCGEAIISEPIVQALNSDWHSKCFRCSTCGGRLNNWYIQNNGNLFCRRDYWSKFGDLCNGCSLVTSGPVMVAGEHRYHPECFQCSVCQSLIGDGDSYALVERTFLYCGQCYRSGIARSSSPVLETSPPSASRTPRRKPHSIQMVEIPPTPDNSRLHHQQPHRRPQHRHDQQNGRPQETHGQQRDEGPVSLMATPYESGTLGAGYRNSFILDSNRSMPPCFQISSLDSTSVYQDLAVGDRILEVDGTAVRDKTLEEINHLLTNYQKPVHVMVERDLSPLRLPPEEDGGQASSPRPLNKSLSRSSLEDPNSSPASDNETVVFQGTPVRLRPKGSLRAKGHSPSRRRSKSPSPHPQTRQKSIDLNRSHSFSTRQQDHRSFRAVDLILGDVLGQGFFGQAIKATHRVTGEQMVLKELHNFDEAAQKSFLREVSMLRGLSHPCVLKFMGVLYRDKKLNLVTEFIDGGTLSDLLLDHSVELCWKQRVAFAKDIAAGMRYLHSMNVIHRDLNSQNCLVRKDLGVVVADFGLAKIFPHHENVHMPSLTDREKEALSGAGKLSGKKRRFSRKKRQTVVGNPYWMAPEMMTKGEYDEKVDVFSYGIIVCETIARVTADPDYLPRSIDFGLNVEAFHKRFCEGSPEPYFMLAVLCSQIEPDQRPSFEKIHVLCEALDLHIEHGMAVPPELQGSTVEFYRNLKESMYGKDFKDIDSCTQADREETDVNQNNVKGSEACDLTDGPVAPREEKKSLQPGSCLSGSSGSTASQDNSLSTFSDLEETEEAQSKAAAGGSVNGTTSEVAVSTLAAEDQAYFSCSSAPSSLSPSSPCLSMEEFASCKDTSDSSSESMHEKLSSLAKDSSINSMSKDEHSPSPCLEKLSGETDQGDNAKSHDREALSLSQKTDLAKSPSKDRSTMQLEYGEQVVSPPHLSPSGTHGLSDFSPLPQASISLLLSPPSPNQDAKPGSNPRGAFYLGSGLSTAFTIYEADHHNSSMDTIEEKCEDPDAADSAVDSVSRKLDKQCSLTLELENAALAANSRSKSCETLADAVRPDIRADHAKPNWPVVSLPFPLSPGHERGLSSSRRRLRRSLQDLRKGNL